MTKQEEITAWRTLLNSLSEDSYTFTYVRDQIDTIEQAINGDLLPELNGGETLSRYADRVMEKLKEETLKCEERVAEAKKTAEIIVEGAHDRASALTERTINEISSISRQLDFLVEKL
mgnify:CR=1 FL=1